MGTIRASFCLQTLNSSPACSSRRCGSDPNCQRRRSILGRLRRPRLQLLALVVDDERFDDVVEPAVHDTVQLMQGEADAVVGDAVLGEVVSADLLAAVARADLRAALLGNLLLLLLKFHLVEARAEDA